MKKLIEEYLEKVKTTIDNLDRNEVGTFIQLLLKARDDDNTIFVMGNGGSGSTASHFMCDIAKSASLGKAKRFKVICLNDNNAIMMAYSNDMSYEDIFIEQLKNLFKKGDLVIGFSGSGNSKNVLKAIDYANKNGGVSVGVTGHSGGMLKKLAKYSVNANVNDMQVSEDIHMMLLHLTMQYFMRQVEGMSDKEFVSTPCRF